MQWNGRSQALTLLLTSRKKADCCPTFEASSNRLTSVRGPLKSSWYPGGTYVEYVFVYPVVSLTALQMIDPQRDQTLIWEARAHKPEADQLANACRVPAASCVKGPHTPSSIRKARSKRTYDSALGAVDPRATVVGQQPSITLRRNRHRWSQQAPDSCQ